MTILQFAEGLSDRQAAQALHSHRIEDYRLPPTKAERDRYGELVGTDGNMLLRWIDQAQDRPWLRELPAVAILRRVWEQHNCW